MLKSSIILFHQVTVFNCLFCYINLFNRDESKEKKNENPKPSLFYSTSFLPNASSPPPNTPQKNTLLISGNPYIVL